MGLSVSQLVHVAVAVAVVAVAFAGQDLGSRVRLSVTVTQASQSAGRLGDWDSLTRRLRSYCAA